MFPGADIPVVQLSVDADCSEEELYAIGQSLLM
jgi:aromatic ring-opening dioxygenase catalytic subunit (LigB family)